MKKQGKRKRMSGTDLTQHLLNDPSIADKLRLVDDYITHRMRAGRRFILPNEHGELEPLIEEYGANFAKFVNYVRSLRDTVMPRSEVYISLHELYRTLEVRLVQQQRRDRARRALEIYERKNPRASYDDKMRWLRKLEQSWGRRRMAKMEEYRRKTATGRLSTEEREGILKEFWQDIDREIAVGKIV